MKYSSSSSPERSFYASFTELTFVYHLMNDLPFGSHPGLLLPTCRRPETIWRMFCVNGKLPLAHPRPRASSNPPLPRYVLCTYDICLICLKHVVGEIQGREGAIYACSFNEPSKYRCASRELTIFSYLQRSSSYNRYHLYLSLSFRCRQEVRYPPSHSFAPAAH